MISVSNLSKSFGEFCAVNDISFSVQPGEVLGFLGPNGAGKSTTMKMLTGFLAPSSGTVSILGNEVAKNAIEAQKVIGYLPEGAPAYADMSVIDSLRFVAKIRGFRGSEIQQRIAKVVSDVELDAVLYKRIENLSKGYRRRLGLAQALLHDPKVLILDEPTDGLDPNQKHQVRKLIKNLAKDKIVIVSTHILEEVSAVCTRAMILADGKILFDGTPVELAAKSDFHNCVMVLLRNEPEELADRLRQLERVERVDRLEDGHLRVISADRASILGEVNQILHSLDCQVEELHVEQGKLDDVFRVLTSGEEVAS